MCTTINARSKRLKGLGVKNEKLQLILQIESFEGYWDTGTSEETIPENKIF